MSGAPPGSEKCEPNLTPLLDMVLQLIMFFMLCANFDKFQKNQALTLPSAVQATAPDKTIDVQLLIELGAPPTDAPDPTKPDAIPKYGKLSLSTGKGSEVFTGPTALEGRLKIEAEKHEIGPFAKPEEGAAKKRKVKVAVILRADQNSTFKEIYSIMSAAKSAGFDDIQLRAQKK